MKKLNQRGIAHWIAPVIVVALIAVIGVVVLKGSHADVISGGSNWVWNPNTPGTYHQTGNLAVDNGKYVWASATPSYIWFGPYISLADNTNAQSYYQANFCYRLTANGTTAVFQVTSNVGQTLLGQQVISNGGYMPSYNCNRTINFQVHPGTDHNIEFRVVLLSGSMRVQQTELWHHISNGN